MIHHPERLKCGGILGEKNVSEKVAPGALYSFCHNDFKRDDELLTDLFVAGDPVDWNGNTICKFLETKGKNCKLLLIQAVLYRNLIDRIFVVSYSSTIQIGVYQRLIDKGFSGRWLLKSKEIDVTIDMTNQVVIDNSMTSKNLSHPTRSLSNRNTK